MKESHDLVIGKNLSLLPDLLVFQSPFKNKDISSRRSRICQPDYQKEQKHEQKDSNDKTITDSITL
jgi:hypothetical protein